MYAKSTLKLWRGISIKTPHKPHQVTNPGKIVSVDRLLSPTPGIVAYMTFILTTKRYNYSTVFVDYFSKYSYIHLQNTTSAEETLGGKYTFESMSSSHGIIIKKYHADNGIFRADALV